MIDDEVPVTYYAVFDGHGGSSCANFLRDNLHLDLKRCLTDDIDGIKDSSDFHMTISNCITRAFEETDSKYRKQYQ